ncbi:unnamed protein product [Trichogramma brassicae]|uniref:Uncharacterized protein n=1 Tax=Trichogramma brassicae TaxID=86971 RepID=A0A6H5J684_9HYME|nr:unnamed protein product [Trichogramma brassicae]
MWSNLSYSMKPQSGAESLRRRRTRVRWSQYTGEPACGERARFYHRNMDVPTDPRHQGLGGAAIRRDNILPDHQAIDWTRLFQTLPPSATTTASAPNIPRSYHKAASTASSGHLLLSLSSLLSLVITLLAKEDTASAVQQQA